jgi:hypothetical protein
MTLNMNVIQNREKGKTPFVPNNGENVLTKNVNLLNVCCLPDVYT